MEEKHALTERLKVIETEIYESRVDMKGIGIKLEYAHQYEDELVERLNQARAKTKELRMDFFKKSGEISSKYNDMKEIFDVFTGNFYKQTTPLTQHP